MLGETYEPCRELPFGFCCPAQKGVKGFHFGSETGYKSSMRRLAFTYGIEGEKNAADGIL